MKKTIYLLFVLTLFLLPCINADLITPGTKTIEVKNIITNINDFPDYYFIALCQSVNPFIGIPQIMSGEEIPFSCSYRARVSIYVVKKTDFNASLLASSVENGVNVSYFNQSIFREVISEVYPSKTVSISSTSNEEIIYYTLDKDLLSSSKKSVIERDYLTYVYIFLAVLALIVMTFILLRRKNESSD